MDSMVKYIGVNDRTITLFEGQFAVEKGMAYNSYIIEDERIAVLDSVDAAFGEEWLNNIENAIGEREPDYLIVQHMEPDHSANIHNFVKRYPKAKIVSNELSFQMMKNFFSEDFSDKKIAVKDGDTLSLGKTTLSFITAAMVHWPEVIMTYFENEKALFSADAFGKFGTTDADEDWACEARRYYFGIVGKYGAQVQNLFKKLEGLEIKTLYPLHGPILSDNLNYYLNLYNIWSSYEVESEGVAIAYTSVYGNTKKAVDELIKQLKANGCENVAVSNLAVCDMAEAVEDAFRYGSLVLATTTYNAGIFPFMHTFIEALKERGYKNRTVAIIENGSWKPMAAATIKKMLADSKNISFADNSVTINSAPNKENYEQLRALACELCSKND